MTRSPRLSHAHYLVQIEEQTRLLREALRGADLSARVPTCPDWTLRGLAVHLGGAHRWVAETVRRRSERPLTHDEVPGHGGPADRDGGDRRDGEVDGADALDAWLAEGAGRLRAALEESGPDTRVWTWSSHQRTGFWARRMTHETVIHRADACGASGTPYTVDGDVAADCVDEWLEIVTSPEAQAHDPRLAGLRERAGSTLHLHADDQDGAEWLITLGEDGARWDPRHAKADVAVRGGMADVLRVLYRRLPPTDPGVTVHGDAGLLDFWLARTRFGG